MFEGTIDLFANSNNALPRTEEEYMELFPGHPELQWLLQDVYHDYPNYCALVVRCFRNQPSRK
jgi:hypothetical protein